MSKRICSEATSSPKTVSVSAIRVIGRRHSAPVSCRAAEISVPAMLTPIRKIKLTM